MCWGLEEVFQNCGISHKVCLGLGAFGLWVPKRKQNTKMVLGIGDIWIVGYKGQKEIPKCAADLMVLAFECER